MKSTSEYKIVRLSASEDSDVGQGQNTLHLQHSADKDIEKKINETVDYCKQFNSTKPESLKTSKDLIAASLWQCGQFHLLLRQYDHRYLSLQFEVRIHLCKELICGPYYFQCIRYFWQNLSSLMHNSEQLKNKLNKECIGLTNVCVDFCFCVYYTLD